MGSNDKFGGAGAGRNPKNNNRMLSIWSEKP